MVRLPAPRWQPQENGDGMKRVIRDVRAHELDAVLAMNNAAGAGILPIDRERLEHHWHHAALPPMQISLAAASDIGRVRELNEDAILVGDLESKRQWPAPELAQGATCHGMRGPLAVVCDGMGGGDGGEIASELAASVIWHTLVTTEGSDVVFVTARQLRRAMRAASASKGVPVLDLDYLEDSNCETDMNVVMTGSGGFVEVQGTAEGSPFSRAELDALLELAGAGITRLVAEQKQALGLA